MKKLTVSVLIAAFVANASLPAYSAALTDPSDISKALTYGLNTATYTTEKKDPNEGLKKLVAYDLIWDLLGENEKILSGSTEAVIPQLKDRALQLQAVIVGIDELSTKLGEGKYDEALFATINTGVSLVNHPVINALWEAIKLAYESEKLVRSTKAELQIEQLYNVVNSDRRIIGVSDGQSPKLIDVNSDTVTYFFNKYLITDASTREMVKAYVQVRLGEEFPELPTGSWLYAKLTMTAETEEEEYQLRKLQEFENVSRSWIMKLLNDLNNQVKIQWAEARIRQFNAELAKFKAQFEGFNSSIKDIEASFINMKSEQKNFPQYIEKSKAELENFKKIVNSQTKTSLEGAYGLNKQAVKWYYQNNQYRSYAMSIGDVGASTAFASQIESWNSMINTIASLIKELEKISKTEKEQEVIEYYKNREYGSISAAAYQSNYAGFMTEPPLTDIEVVKTNYVTLLLKIMDKVDVIYSNTVGEEAVKQCNTTCSDKPQDKIWECQAPCRELQIKFDNEKQQKVDEVFKEAVDYIQQYKEDEQNKFNEYSTKVTSAIYKQNEADNAALKVFWKDFRAAGKRHDPSDPNPEVMQTYEKYVTPMYYAIGVYSRFNGAFQEKLKNDIVQLNDILGSFYALCTNLKEKNVPEYQNFANQAKAFYAPLGINSTKINDAYEQAVSAQQYLNENSYTFLGKFSSGNIDNVDSVLIAKAEEILAASRDIEAASMQMQATFPVVIKEWEAVSKRYTNWKNENHMEGDSSSLSSILLPYFADEERTEMEKLERAYNESNAKIGKIKSVLSSFPQSAKTEINNREQDAEYLYELALDWKKWYQGQKAKGIITENQNGEITLGIRKCEKTGMAILYEPYAHYAEEKELKNNNMAKEAMDSLKTQRVYTFITSNMPNIKQKLDNMLKLSDYAIAKEPNFIFVGNVLYKSDLEKIGLLVDSLNPEKDDSYLPALKEIAQKLPLTITFPELNEKNKNDYASKIQNKYGVFNDRLTTYDLVNIETGKQFVDLREKVRAKMILKGQIIEKKHFEEFIKAEALKRLAEYSKQLDVIAKTLAPLTEQDKINELYQEYWALRTKYTNDEPAHDSSFTARIMNFDNEFTQKSRSAENNIQEQINKVKQLYSGFKSAYESKSESELVNFLSRDWLAADGTSISDLENNFRNMFSVYDSIQYVISNLNVVKNPTTGMFYVSYDVTITGQIYDMGVTRNEKSSVKEDVIFEKDSPKINRTVSGQFWYRE